MGKLGRSSLEAQGVEVAIRGRRWEEGGTGWVLLGVARIRRKSVGSALNSPTPQLPGNWAPAQLLLGRSW